MPSYILVVCVCLVFSVKRSLFETIHFNETVRFVEPTDSDVSGMLEVTSPSSVRQGVTRMIAMRDFGGRTPISNETLEEMDESLGSNETEIDNITIFNNMLNDTWLDLATVMDIFTERKYDNSSAVQALTAAYHYTHRQQKKLKTLPTYLKKPFIVIEGLDREKRNTLAKRLALHLQGHVVDNPPDTFDAVLRNMPDNSTFLTNSFYVLSTYVAALHVRYVTQTAPAIIAGYWLGRAAFLIARHFTEKPPPYKSKFWVWPKDLVKPDIVFYLTDRFSLHQFSDHLFVNRYLHIFNNWDDPKCVPLANTQSIETMMEEIEPYLRQL